MLKLVVLLNSIFIGCTFIVLLDSILIGCTSVVLLDSILIGCASVVLLDSILIGCDMTQYSGLRAATRRKCLPSRGLAKGIASAATMSGKKAMIVEPNMMIDAKEKRFY